MAPLPELLAGLAPGIRRREEEIEKGLERTVAGLFVGRARMNGHLGVLRGHPATRSCSDQDELAHAFGKLERDRLGDEPAHRETEQVKPGESERVEEIARAPRHVVDARRRRATRDGNARSIARNDWVNDD